MFLGSKQPDY